MILFKKILKNLFLFLFLFFIGFFLIMLIFVGFIMWEWNRLTELFINVNKETITIYRTLFILAVIFSLFGTVKITFKK